jgi:hypothetical protein
MDPLCKETAVEEKKHDRAFALWYGLYHKKILRGNKNIAGNV